MTTPLAPQRGTAGSISVLLTLLLVAGGAHGAPRSVGESSLPIHAASSGAVGNFSAAIDRLVGLVGAAGGGLLALVWARVALSWFSNDVAKKVQAKDRARDALVGTLIFVAAISGLFWALAQWVVSGS